MSKLAATKARDPAVTAGDAFADLAGELEAVLLEPLDFLLEETRRGSSRRGRLDFLG